MDQIVWPLLSSCAMPPLCVLSTSSIWTPTSFGPPLGEFRCMAYDILGFLDQSCEPLSRVWHEASLYCWCHVTCLSFEFQCANRSVENHGGCDLKFVMVERCIGGDEDVWKLWDVTVHYFITVPCCVLTTTYWNLKPTKIIQDTTIHASMYSTYITINST
jgi:hypothetical protein